jgi:hypothetical protein
MRFRCESRATRREFVRKEATRVSLLSSLRGTACRIVTEGHSTTS